MGATAIVFTEVKDKSGEWKALPLYREGYSGGLELCPVMDGYSDLYDFIKFAADYGIANDLSKEVSTVLRADRLADFKGECPSGGILRQIFSAVAYSPYRKSRRPRRRPGITSAVGLTTLAGRSFAGPV